MDLKKLTAADIPEIVSVAFKEEHRHRNASILHDARNGLTNREIARRHGVSGTRVAGIISKALSEAIRREFLRSADPDKIDHSALSARSANGLLNMGVTRFSQLKGFTEHDLLERPNLGKKSVDEIKAEMAERGLCLKPIHPYAHMSDDALESFYKATQTTLDRINKERQRRAP